MESEPSFSLELTQFQSTSNEIDIFGFVSGNFDHKDVAFCENRSKYRNDPTIMKKLRDAANAKGKKPAVAISKEKKEKVVKRDPLPKILSNGVYKSIEHRAVVNSNEERPSLATMYIFNLDSELGPAHSLIGPNNPPIFQRIPVGKYLIDFYARKLDGKSSIDRMKVEIKDHES